MMKASCQCYIELFLVYIKKISIWNGQNVGIFRNIVRLLLCRQKNYSYPERVNYLIDLYILITENSALYEEL